MSALRVAAIRADGAAPPGRGAAGAASAAASFPQLLDRAGTDARAAEGVAGVAPRRSSATAAPIEAPPATTVSENFSQLLGRAGGLAATADGVADIAPWAEGATLSAAAGRAPVEAEAGAAAIIPKAGAPDLPAAAAGGNAARSPEASQPPSRWRSAAVSDNVDQGVPAERMRTAAPRTAHGASPETAAAHGARKPTPKSVGAPAPPLAAGFVVAPALVSVPDRPVRGPAGESDAAASVSAPETARREFVAPGAADPDALPGDGDGAAVDASRDATPSPDASPAAGSASPDGGGAPIRAPGSPTFVDMLGATGEAILGAATASAPASALTDARPSGSAATASPGTGPASPRPALAGATAGRVQPAAADRAAAPDLMPDKAAPGSADATPTSVSAGDLGPHAIGADGSGGAADRRPAAAPRAAPAAVAIDTATPAALGSSVSDAVSATSAAGVATNPLAISASSAGATVPAPPDAGAAQPALSELPADAVRHVLGSTQSGGGEMVLQLHPPELGELSIRVSVDGRDVSAWFASPHAAVQQALSATLGQLHADLGNAGYSLVGAWVGSDASGAGARGGTSPALQRERRKTETAAPEGTPTAPLAADSQGVSIYV